MNIFCHSSKIIICERVNTVRDCVILWVLWKCITLWHRFWISGSLVLCYRGLLWHVNIWLGRKISRHQHLTASSRSNYWKYWSLSTDLLTSFCLCKKRQKFEPCRSQQIYEWKTPKPLRKYLANLTKVGRR